MASPLTPPPLHYHPPPLLPTSSISRRSLLLLSSSSLSLPPSSPSPPPPPPSPIDTTITDRVFMDFSLCPSSFRPERDSICPTTTTPLGRLVIGLYGHLVPTTVSIFKSLCTSSSTTYKNTRVHKIFPGQFILAGRQSPRGIKGKIHPPMDFLPRNNDIVDSRAFMLTHSRGGVVSLCLSENDDDDETKLDPDYRNVEFLITTGPGPCPQLDSKNIVFGTVLQGMDVVTAIAAMRTYKPWEQIQILNYLAGFLGDERAEHARAIWNMPIKTVYISDCGELKVTKPSLPPSLP
ncbi:hypothetical protein ACOSQ4_012498 [Xanthoceras sorbifolium]